MPVHDALIKHPDRLESAFTQHCLNLPNNAARHSSEVGLKQLFENAFDSWQNTRSLSKHSLKVIRATEEHPEKYDKTSIERRFQNLHALGPVMLAIYMSYVTPKHITRDHRDKVCRLNDKQLGRIVSALLLNEDLKAALEQFRLNVVSDAPETSGEKDAPHHHLPLTIKRKINELPPFRLDDLRNATIQRWFSIQAAQDRNDSYL